MRLKPKQIMRLFKYWPPFLSSGISVKEFDLDQGYVVSQMKLSKWNANYFGTMYGGSLFSMCDPFFVFILSHKLGKNYYIWDKAAKIEFIKATKNKVTARFSISPEEIEAIVRDTANNKKVTPIFHAEILDSAGDLIAKVEKTLYIKRKPQK